jgi:Response regulator containing a CheY-like receiver domain and an HTH DNA-binding domain
MSGKQASSRVGNPSPLDLEHDRAMLSNRESEVVRLSRSKSYATIADELGIAESTVGTYRSRATEKLNDQVKVIRRMLRQQQADQQQKNIKKIAREAVERLKDCGIEVEFEIEPNKDVVEPTDETTSTQQPQTTTETVDMTQGKLGDDHEYTERSREYANKVIHGDEWELSDVDLSKVIFETRKKARRQHGVASYNGDDSVTVGISEHSIKNAGFDTIKQTIRHELVHVWQYQHQDETVELPNGNMVQDVSTGHTGCWYDWEEIMDVQRSNNYYSKSSEDYNYRIWCTSCHQFQTGKYRLCKTIKLHSENYAGCGWCGRCDDERTDGSTFVVTDDNDDFYDSKEAHEDW